MRVLMTTHPGLGHLHPMVPIARALISAGHEVAFACAQRFCAKIESLGFRAFPAGLDWLESEAERAFPQLTGVSLERNPAWFLKEVFVGVAAELMIPDLLDICRRWKPDLLVRNDCEFAACIVSELLDIRYATISIEMFLPARWWNLYIADRLARLRAAWGLEPDPGDDMFHRHLYLSLAPPSFQFPEYHLPPAVHSLSPIIFDNSDGGGLPDWIKHLPTRPTVYATLGTVFNHRMDVFHSIVDGLCSEPINLILTVGSNSDLEQFGEQPPNVYIERYIPMSLLLPHCQVAITHGGFGTTLAVLRQGLPNLVVPVSGTDPFRALRCISTGIGLALKVPGFFYGTGLGFEEMSAASVRRSVRELLDNPTYRHNAQILRDEAMSLPGPERAVELLTRLAEGRAAQPSVGRAHN
jgi:UDP:flavonoid glycosyltransferase YjiC (YdhE family)